MNIPRAYAELGSGFSVEGLVLEFRPLLLILKPSAFLVTHCADMVPLREYVLSAETRVGVYHDLS